MRADSARTMPCREDQKQSRLQQLRRQRRDTALILRVVDRQAQRIFFGASHIIEEEGGPPTH